MSERLQNKNLGHNILKIITEVLVTFSPRKRLKQALAIPLYSNAFYLMFNTAITSSLGFLFWLIVARFYTEAEVGFSSAIISILSLLTIVSLVGLNTSLVRFMPQSKKPQDLINTCLTLNGALTLVIAGIFVAGLDFWSPALGFIKENTIFYLAFLTFALLSTLSSLVDATFLAKRRAGFVLSKNTVFSLLKLPLPILLVLFFHTFAIVASWGIALGVAMAISILLFLPKVQKPYKPMPTLKLGLIKGMWRYSAHNYLANLFSVAPTLILPIMVVNILGPEQNAYFYIGLMIANLLFAIPTAVSQSLFAEGAHFEDKLKENVVKSLKFTFLLLVPAIILLIFVGKWLLLAFGESYSLNALKLLWILCVSSLPIGITSIYIAILRVKNRLKELVAIWGFIAPMVLFTSYLIIPTTGIIGIGYAWLGIHSIAAVYAISVFKLALRP